ncbi:MAG: hypothetical protein ABIO26_08540 [Croceibacterium sp.]
MSAAFAAAVSAPGLAQGAAATGASACFIELPQLMADGPTGIADLRAAIAQLDQRLRPQVEEVNRLKRLVQTLEQQQQQASPASETGEEDAAPAPGAAATRDQARIAADLRQTNLDLIAKQAQLQADYQAQMRAIVGPVQQRIGQRAAAFSAQRGCGHLKMARTPDLAALRSAGARDLTGEFAAWYATGKS